MRKVSSMRKIKSEDLVSRLDKGMKHSRIGLRTRVGLYIGIGSTKQFFGTVNGQLLYLVYHFATTVVALSWVTLSIFIGKY